MGYALTNSVCPNVPPQTAKHDSRHRVFLNGVTSTEERKEKEIHTKKEKRERDRGKDVDRRALGEHCGDDQR